MIAIRLLATTLIVGVILSAAHAAERDAAIANGAKLTKADAARTATGGARAGDSADAIAPDAAARGIEKKDIRRGMVVAKPGSITPHTKSTRRECPPDCVAPPAATITTPRD